MTDNGERFCMAARGPGIRRILRSLAFALVVLALPAPGDVGAAGTRVSREYQVKAAFLYNFTKFVDWPPEKFSTEESPLAIGVLGHNPFGEQLEMGVADRRVNDRGIDVRYLDAVDVAGDVHIVFVPNGDENLVDGSIESLHKDSVLTIGESRTFRELGGIITFTLRDGRIRFFINRTAAEEAGLKMNAQLLRLALDEE